MVDRDFQPFLKLLEQVVNASRAKTRDLERAMGLASGYLGKVLDGTIEIKVRHLVGLAKFLEVPPAEFLELGFPKLSGNTRFHLADWLGPRQAAAHAAKDRAESTEDLQELVRRLVREELARGAAPAAQEVKVKPRPR